MARGDVATYERVAGGIAGGVELFRSAPDLADFGRCLTCALLKVFGELALGLPSGARIVGNSVFDELDAPPLH